METIATRIMELVEMNGGNMSDFARSIDVTPAYISKLKNKPESVPSTDVINKICARHNVREAWLRNGEGPMRHPEPGEDMGYLNALLAGDDADTVNFIKKFLLVYKTLTPDDRKVIEKLIRALLDDR